MSFLNTQLQSLDAQTSFTSAFMWLLRPVKNLILRLFPLQKPNMCMSLVSASRAQHTRQATMVYRHRQTLLLCFAEQRTQYSPPETVSSQLNAQVFVFKHEVTLSK